ncbi:hypothetical protein HAX54_042688 [Datura stramonium]|uniref:Mitochondrial acidic protein MAM33 n=1 Tax=Datura stramonium TaxID=4076 RepID=A0ABS8W189_DATST|nr:hypothetical protein [Datura stramonium]
MQQFDLHKFELQDTVVDIPDDFPFKVQDKAGKRVIILTRNCGDETINIVVDLLNARCENVEGDAVNSEEESEPQPSVPLSVTVSKENGLSLEFDVRAFPNKISICGISIKEAKSSSNQLDCKGPAFSLVNESLQKSFYEYLEVRGLTGSIANFLLEYVISKDTKEYTRWLKNIKNFVEH